MMENRGEKTPIAIIYYCTEKQNKQTIFDKFKILSPLCIIEADYICSNSSRYRAVRCTCSRQEVVYLGRQHFFQNPSYTNYVN